MGTSKIQWAKAIDGREVFSLTFIIWRQPFSTGLAGLEMEMLLCAGMKACVAMPSGKGTL